MTTPRVIAVDWSGRAAGAAASIWLAEARGGELVALENGRDRDALVAHLCEAARAPGELVVGLDFAFSFPRWWCAERGWSRVAQVWKTMAAEGEQLLARCEPPFWGRPGRRRPEHEGLRRTDRVPGSRTAKSVFQIGGSGAVGTGSVRGMPYLTQLRDAGFSVWPFDPPGRLRIFEIYPRDMTGPVVKRDAAQRTAHLRRHHPRLIAGTFGEAAAGGEDAFDAAVSALVMERAAARLSALPASSDGYALLEGEIWRPDRVTRRAGARSAAPG